MLFAAPETGVRYPARGVKRQGSPKRAPFGSFGATAMIADIMIPTGIMIAFFAVMPIDHRFGHVVKSAAFISPAISLSYVSPERPSVGFGIGSFGR
jgi:hypothetical protein